MNESVAQHRAFKWRTGAMREEPDRLAVEEPLEIRLGGRRFTLTMRTPGHDEELAAGFLLAEGFINNREELGEIRRLRDAKGAPDPNAIDVILNVPATGLRERLQRNFTVSSSCGVCGKTSIESIERRMAPLTSTVAIGTAALLRLPTIMREAQAVFAATGGLHAAALFELKDPNEPELIVLREDVGRHNAVDKVMGYAIAREITPLSRHVLMASGRLSFEIVQKTAAAGVPILCAVSAPSSLAVDLAEELGMTLVGFVRESNFNIYSHPERVVIAAANGAEH
jgi:FdhD protein